MTPQVSRMTVGSLKIFIKQTLMNSPTFVLTLSKLIQSQAGCYQIEMLHLDFKIPTITPESLSPSKDPSDNPLNF
ncbi:hypothetical protein LXL04_004909 [Taraxacum kok-saghyz]